jgi:hypothetical protein
VSKLDLYRMNADFCGTQAYQVPLHHSEAIAGWKKLRAAWLLLIKIEEALNADMVATMGRLSVEANGPTGADK